MRALAFASGLVSLLCACGGEPKAAPAKAAGVEAARATDTPGAVTNPAPKSAPNPATEHAPNPATEHATEWEPAFVAKHNAASCEAAACVKLGLAHYDTVLSSDNPDEVREQAYMMQRRACAAGIQAGCYEQAMLLRSGLVLELGEADLARTRAIELFDRSCDGGWGRSCYRRGEDHHDTPEGQRYYARSIELYTPACAGGDMEQCSLLAYTLQLGRGAPSDPVRANALYKKACTGGDGYGCEMHGRILAKPPDGIDKDTATAVDMFRRACEIGAPFYGCYEGGLRLARGQGVRAKIDEGVDLLRSGCTDGTGVADARACNELEDLCREGFEQACG